MKDVEAYIRAIRNSEKRSYALAYAAHLQGGPKPDYRTFGISLMAAQAVEINLGASQVPFRV